MATNIIDALQQRLGYGPLQKIDPNTQEIKDAPDSNGSLLAQAAIPATLVGIYKHTRSNEDAVKLVSGKNSTSLLSLLFDGADSEVIAKVAKYGSVSGQQAEEIMERTAAEALTVIKESTGTDSSGQVIKDYMAAQRQNILLYLPAELQIGNLLNDNTVDDRTNKMEGPVSDFMHKIEKAFSSSD
ncbi:hypothetical protein [Foetidibacter luteolus]|uniref:hypothetical protein n=1 Tax=Foetidibacter luteolus TaxID=2608880 RepID=UPI00129B86B0|nr:hypothetical protein [Foetidibacter luteolus]